MITLLERILTSLDPLNHYHEQRNRRNRDFAFFSTFVFRSLSFSVTHPSKSILCQIKNDKCGHRNRRVWRPFFDYISRATSSSCSAA